MATAAPPKPKHDWADDDDIEETTTDLPPPQTISNKDGTKTIITFRYNDQGQKVKTTRRVRYVTHTETVNPRVADRKTWSKFGQSAKDGAGPAADTTSIGENIIFRPSVNWRKDAKDESQDPNAQSMKDKLKDKQVKCRICNGEHFTARCPYKDTMAPIGESGAADVAAGMGDEPSYGERDDFATLRVTNVSEMAEEGELRDMFERFGRVTRVFLAKDRDTGMAKGFAFISFADRGDAVKACNKMDGYGFKHLILRVEFAKKAQ
ncbi:eukaryotic translation initiation factor 3 subunit G domain-containing protein [Hirsutella rhossiliensis]|uniref:Eukaryotic translation initiation factor 3 subunit G n=1 Tax=Hirsutella rhossiliensis TaxID=111463 RepID=A0A9P8SM42_9HYPO|nr:eukaryotic translation initiation factor 3 subunit G domain-containing protein [Hirsutella rhossiliensis]KAH0965796.1 eukaryotic translation initiation factor 3 subunit G domain-containing protein [Hirsutella rhossiliensis]